MLTPLATAVVAPPEAPVNGYMFDKGIYLADMSSKSAGYCAAYNSGGNALLLLCDAELGNPMQILTNAQYNAGETARAQGLHSTWGQGSMGPPKWKDAKCLHPSLAGVKMVCSFSKVVRCIADMVLNSLTLQVHRATRTSLARRCSTMSTSRTRSIKYACATCCVFVCERSGLPRCDVVAASRNCSCWALPHLGLQASCHRSSI